MSSPELSMLNVVGGRYVLEVSIGRGGMGEVWRAKHIALNSYVAIKLLHGALASETRTRQRFLKEAQLTAQLKTRHAVQVFDFGVTEEGIPYLVMELLDGETLDQRLNREGRLLPDATVRILRPAGRALDRAHQLGIIHRDFKPENLFIVADEEGVESVKVVDFGIAKLVGELEADPASASVPAAVGKQALSTFTRTATLVGTPYYMGPEQIRPKAPLTPAVDIWALGVVAFECLTGRRPFDADELALLFHRIERIEHVRASELVEGVPAAFDGWFERACAVEPQERFATAHEAVEELTRALRLDQAATSSPTEAPAGLWLQTPPGHVPSLAAVSRERTAVSASSDEHVVSPATTLHSLSQHLAGFRRWSKPVRVAAAAAGLLVVVLGIIVLTRGHSASELPTAAAIAGNSTSLSSDRATQPSPAPAAAPPSAVAPAATLPAAATEKVAPVPSAHVTPESLPLADATRSPSPAREDPAALARVRRAGINPPRKPPAAQPAATAQPAPPQAPPPPVAAPPPEQASPFRLPPLGI